jgi:hypothetical protein
MLRCAAKVSFGWNEEEYSIFPSHPKTGACTHRQMARTTPPSFLISARGHHKPFSTHVDLRSNLSLDHLQSRNDPNFQACNCGWNCDIVLVLLLWELIPAWVLFVGGERGTASKFHFSSSPALYFNWRFQLVMSVMFYCVIHPSTSLPNVFSHHAVALEPDKMALYECSCSTRYGSTISSDIVEALVSPMLLTIFIPTATTTLQSA